MSNPQQADTVTAEAMEEVGRIEETTFPRRRELMRNHPDGVFLVSQSAREALCAPTGASVGIASIPGMRAATLPLARRTSRAAETPIARQQAAGPGEYFARANCLAAGPVQKKGRCQSTAPEIITAWHDAISLPAPRN